MDKEAGTRARGLLNKRLTPAQRKQWQRSRCVLETVHGYDWLICSTGCSVSEYADGDTHDLGLWLSFRDYPRADSMLANLLLLRQAPQTMWQKACLDCENAGKEKSLPWQCNDNACVVCRD